MIVLLGLMLTTTVMAAETVPQERINLAEIEYKTLLLEQHAKTQNTFKQELAKRDTDIKAYVNEKVDDNFIVLDERINDFIRKATFKLGMVFVSGIVLGGSILLLINNQLRRKRAIKKNLTGTGEAMVLSGNTLTKVKEQMTPETKDQISVEEEEIMRLKQKIQGLQGEIKKEEKETPKKTKKKTEKQVMESIPDPISLKDRTIPSMGDAR